MVVSLNALICNKYYILYFRIPYRGMPDYFYVTSPMSTMILILKTV